MPLPVLQGEVVTPRQAKGTVEGLLLPNREEEDMRELDELVLLGLRQGRRPANRIQVLCKWTCYYIMALIGGVVLGLICGWLLDNAPLW